MKKKLILLTALFLLSSCTGGNISKSDESNSVNSQIEITKNNIDLGEIPMDEGKMNIPFEFTNTGDNNIILGDAETSCMCTKGFITNSEGKDISDTIVMRGHGELINLRRVIKPGEKSFLIAVFDPNAHGPDATGPMSRNIFIHTNSKITPELNFNFLGNVVKTRITPKIIKNDNANNKLNDFSFEEDSFDFGVIKQSSGKVRHDFKFTYNGETPVKITGVPTSCACTVATVNKTEFKKGDTGILTVVFNPNLHAEPEGRFFKSVNLLTDRKLEKIPEVKIWTEINLDLGKNAYELKAEHNDLEIE